MKSSLPIPLEKIVVNEEELLSFNSSVFLKDFCPKKIKSVVPELSEVICHLISLVQPKKYITVDVMKHNFLLKGKTCRDVSFHVDGINNNYILWSIGSFRTEFLMERLVIPEVGNSAPKERAAKIVALTNKTNLQIKEAESSVPMSYDSSCIHRGRTVEAGNKRIMIRICSSDYITPKNVDLKKNF